MIHSIPRDLAWRSLRLALPVAGAYLVVVLGLLAEFLIVGNELGGSGIAAVGYAGTFSLVLVLAFHALEIAAQAIIARRYGEGRMAEAGACLDNALFLSFAVGIPLTILLYLISPWIFSAEANAHIGGMARSYFHHRLPGIPFVIAMLTMIGFFNAISRPVVPMIVYAVVLVGNAVLCHGLVGGHLGLPAMGIAGAGLAQTLSALIGFAGFFAVLLQPRLRARYRVLQVRAHLDRAVLKSLARLSLPIFLQQFLGNFGMFLFVLIVSKVPDGGISLSAATIARNVGYLTYLPGLGFGIAAATMVGQYLGARKLPEARMSGFICWVLGALMMGVGGLCYIFFRHELVDLFLAHQAPSGGAATGSDDPRRVTELATALLIIIGVYQPLEAVNTIVGKALQGAGDTLFVMVVSVVFQWLVFLPLAWFLAIPMELGAYGAIFALAIQLSLISLVFIFKYRGEGWQKTSV